MPKTAQEIIDLINNTASDLQYLPNASKELKTVIATGLGAEIAAAITNTSMPMPFSRALAAYAGLSILDNIDELLPLLEKYKNG